MKAIKFLTLTLVANLVIAVGGGWNVFNKALVIINAIGVLLLIALELFTRKTGDVK